MNDLDSLLAALSCHVCSSGGPASHATYTLDGHQICWKLERMTIQGLLVMDTCFCSSSFVCKLVEMHPPQLKIRSLWLRLRPICSAPSSKQDTEMETKCRVQDSSKQICQAISRATVLTQPMNEAVARLQHKSMLTAVFFQYQWEKMKMAVVFLLLGRLALVVVAEASSESELWVSLDASSANPDQLKYRKTGNGDQIMDFSSVGYKGRAAPFPYPDVKKILHPSGGDDTEQLQKAIDEVSAMEADALGLRGTIKLAPGRFNLGNKTISIQASGVVIDGSGTDEHSGTVLDAHELAPNILFRITGYGEPRAEAPTAIVTGTAPSGTVWLRVNNTCGFETGDFVLVKWPWSRAWIEMMNMSEYWGYRTGHVTTIERRIEAVVDKNTLQLDIPLPFRIDMEYLDSNFSAYVQKMELPVRGRISNVGLQNFRAVKDATPPSGTGCFLKMNLTEDSWVSNLVLIDFAGTVIANGRVISNTSELIHSTMFIGGKQITVQGLTLYRSIPAANHGPKPFDIALQAPGQQILVRDVTTTGDNQYSLMTNNGIPGPNVFFNCTSYGKNSAQPHEWFATALLYDNLNIPNGTIELINRKDFGHGQGIAMGYGVLWNSRSLGMDVIGPPGGANWALGCEATARNNTNIGSAEAGIFGAIDACNMPSLYLAQHLAASTQFS